jgi:hypothetical protein
VESLEIEDGASQRFKAEVCHGIVALEDDVDFDGDRREACAATHTVLGIRAVGLTLEVDRSDAYYCLYCLPL